MLSIFAKATASLVVLIVIRHHSTFACLSAPNPAPKCAKEGEVCRINCAKPENPCNTQYNGGASSIYTPTCCGNFYIQYFLFLFTCLGDLICSYRNIWYGYRCGKDKDTNPFWRRKKRSVGKYLHFAKFNSSIKN